MRINWSNGHKDLQVTDDSYRLREVMGSNNVTLKFSLPDFVEFPLGSFIDYQGQRYTLNRPQSIKEVNSTHFEYTLIFGSFQDLLENYKVKDIEGGLKFPYTAKPHEHVQLLINVLNEYDSGWSLGSCVTNSEKLISYNHTNCLDALQSIAEEFKTEWEVVGKVIHLRKVEYNKTDPLALSYGKGNGFISGVGRSNDDQKAGFNVLYVQGGNRNIDRSKYGSKELLLPKNKEYTYEGVTYVTDAKGLFITQKGVTINNRKEESLDCSHIYPQRVGTISEVVTVDVNKHFYDFKDSSISADLDFSKCRMDGATITIRFESGMLSGREFDVQQEENSFSGYIHAERRFKLVPKEEDGYTMPNETFKPAVGDKYAVFGMMMPNAYISNDSTKTGASWEMFKEACKHFYENHESKFTFKGKLDGIWAKKDWVNIGGKIKTGGFIAFSDPKFQPQGINIRIISVKDYINNPHSPTIELANSVQGGSVVSELDKIQESEVVRDFLHKKALDFTKRRFRDAQQTIKMLQDAQLNFDKGIRPVTVETMSALVGDKSLQFRFIDNKTSKNEIDHAFSYDKTTKKFSSLAGILEHLTIGIEAVKPNQEYKIWDISAYNSAVLDAPEKSYYLYTKVSKSGTTGVFLLSETSIKIDAEAGYYHLLTGILNSELDGERSFVKMYGFTEILPGQIKVNKLTSGNGEQWIKLLHDKIEINGDVSFTYNSPALKQAKEHTIKTLKIGVHNLLVDSQFATKYYQMDADKRARYFDQEQTYTLSVDATCKQNFLGKIYAIGKNIKIKKFEVLGNEDAVLEAHVRRRIKVTFKAVLKYYSQITCKIQNEQDNIPVEVIHPKLELGEMATDWDYASEDLKKEVKKEVREVTHSLEGFQDVVHGAFKDGIIDMAEAKALEKYINLLNTEKADIDKKYQEIYNDSYIMSYAKSNLLAKKVAYDASHNVLISAVSYAIGTGKATAQQKEDVDRKFGLYKTSLASLRQAFEYALKSIETNKANQAESKAKNHATVINSNLANGAVARNTLSASQALAKSEAALAVANGGTMSPEDAVTLANIKAVTEKLTLKTDYINETKINGNTVCTGVLQVGNQHGANAFISGVDTGASAPRFGAGVNWFNRYTAPFRVTDDGSLYATKANITGNINATSGSFSGNISALSGNIGKFQIDSNGLAKSYDSGYVGYGATLNSDKIELNKRVGIGTPSMYNGYNYYTNTITGNEIVLQAGSNKVVISATGITINGRNL